MTESNAQNNSPSPTENPDPNPEGDLQKRIEDLETQTKEKENKYLYLYAEFENFKKRAQRERDDLRKFGWENTARDLLMVADNLERALEHSSVESGNTVLQGVKLVCQHFKKILENSGITEMNPIDQPFDPNVHEAIAEQVTDTPPGTIVKVEQKGYSLHGRLLRPARVVVSTQKQ